MASMALVQEERKEGQELSQILYRAFHWEVN